MEFPTRQLCSQVMRCYLDNCLGKSATNCVLGQCGACLAGGGTFVTVSSCLQSKCTTQCPMLIP